MAVLGRARRDYLGFPLNKKKTRARKTDVLFQWAHDERAVLSAASVAACSI